MSLRALAVLPILLLALARTASADPSLLWSDMHGPADKARSIVFVSEGYAEKDRSSYEKRVHAFIDALETDTASMVRAHPEGYNFHAVWVASQGPAPHALGGPAGATAFKMHVLANGFIVADDAAADAAAAAAAPNVDVVVIVGHFDSEGGFLFFGSPLRANADYPPLGARVRVPESQADTLVHELGHAIYSLGDEYSDLSGSIPESEKRFVTYLPNLTCDPSCARFAPVHQGPGVEGGAHYERGVFRAEDNCRMRDSRTRDAAFCSVCRAVMNARPDAAPAPPLVAAPTLAAGPVTIAFDAAAGEPTTRYVATLVRTDGDSPVQVLTAMVEGPVGSLSLGSLVPGARYELSVVAANVAGTSPGTTIELAPGAPATLGIVNALPGS